MTDFAQVEMEAALSEEGYGDWAHQFDLTWATRGALYALDTMAPVGALEGYGENQPTSEFVAVQNLDPIGGNKIQVVWVDTDFRSAGQRVNPGGVVVFSEAKQVAGIVRVQAYVAPVPIRILVLV